MAEYIDRESLINILEAKEDASLLRYKSAFRSALTTVHMFPAADVAPVRHGRWLDMQEDDSTEGMWRCSVCGEDRYFYEGHPIEYEFRFCPNCGARMDLGGAEDA